MEMNIVVLLAATLVPLLIGFIWYNPKVFGKAWMSAAGVTPESAKSANMPMILGLTTLLAFFLAVEMQFVVIHQFGVASLIGSQPDFANEGSESASLMKRITELYGHSHRTFSHGSFHGAIAGFLLALPIIGTNALYERKGFKYVAINAGYWIVCMSLMGGIISQFS